MIDIPCRCQGHVGGTSLRGSSICPFGMFEVEETDGIHRDAGQHFGKFAKKGGSCTPYTHQGSLQCILAQYPTTAGSAQFCLLCCQPEPIPGPSTARRSQLTPCAPCRLPAWLGRAINMPCRTWYVPVHSNTTFPSGSQEIGYSQQKI